MTFLGFETSQETGEPIELYRITQGSNLWLLNSSEDTYTFGGDDYEPAPLTRGRLSDDSEQGQGSLSVSLPATSALAEAFALVVPGQKMSITITRLHRTDGGTPEGVLIFKGFVQGVDFSEDLRLASLNVVPVTKGLARSIPRYSYQGVCNHFLYDSQCKVSQSLFAFTANVSASSGSTITVPGLTASKGADWAKGGFVQLGTTDFRLIIDHPNDTISLLLPFPSDVVGEEVTVFAGCDHSLATCKSKFDNVANYGGFAFVPLLNIFTVGLK